ncbi:MAG: LEA type 2 family protein [Alistipes sp.]|nr:LEA type 2 family protein [Alistipes sp.]
MLCIVFCLGAGSCRRAADKARRNIRVERIEQIEMRGTGGCDIVLEVRNDTRYKLSLNSASFDFFYGSARVVTVALREPVEVPRRGVHRVVTPWKWRIGDPLALYAFSRRLGQDDFSGIAVSCSVAGRGGPVPFLFERERMPLPEFLAAFGLTAQDVKGYLK